MSVKGLIDHKLEAAQRAEQVRHILNAPHKYKMLATARRFDWTWWPVICVIVGGALGLFPQPAIVWWHP